MHKPKLLYVSINDGSDTRINKEVKSLASNFDIYYIGIGQSTERAFIQPYCYKYQIIQGHHKDVKALLKYYWLFVRVFLSNSFQTIHIINEQLLLIFYPFLLFSGRKIVLDVFDSIFLRTGNKYSFLKSISYSLPRTIIVTDDNRKALMPTTYQPKTIVVENFPYQFKENITKISKADELIIFYNGSMSKIRGTEMLLKMLELEPNMKIKMAGWVYDELTQELAKHPQVDFLGVITQQESMQVAAQCDYIVSLYEPINANNINASPNKIYDAIQAQTPVIINGEVKIASFVRENNLGYIIDSFYSKNYKEIMTDLVRLKRTYTFNESIKRKYTWDAIEYKLIQAHSK